MDFIITPMWTTLHETMNFDKIIMDNLAENKRILDEKLEELSKAN